MLRMYADVMADSVYHCMAATKERKFTDSSMLEIPKLNDSLPMS